MLKSIEEIKDVEIEAGVVVNGVDNANLLSVDSTEPIETKNEEKKISDDDIDISEKKEVEVKEEKEEKKEEKLEVKEEKENKEEKLIESTDSKSVQKRINKLTKKMRTAERERDFSNTRVKELEEKLEKFEFKVPDKEGDKKPLKVDFDDEDEYIEALTDWKIDQKLGKDQQNAAKDRQLKEEQEVVKETYRGIDNALDKGEAKYDDFKELVTDKDLVISAEVTQILLDTDIPEDIMYYLGSNPEESERISNLDPLRIAKEIGKIENSLNAASNKEEKKEKKVKKQSNAPAPIKPVKADGVTEQDPNKMSPKEYRAWREKQK